MKKNSPVDYFLAKVAKSGTETQSVWVDEQGRREATVSLKIHQKQKGHQKVSFLFCMYEVILICNVSGYETDERSSLGIEYCHCQWQKKVMLNLHSSQNLNTAKAAHKFW